MPAPTSSDPRLQLLGSYSTPAFAYGDQVECAWRGTVTIHKLTDAPIPWPKGRRQGEKGLALVVYGDLLEALRREASMAIAYWWGVSRQTVCAWRKALGLVGVVNEGEQRLRQLAALDPENMEARHEGIRRTARDPERCEKIAASKRGKPRPEHVQLILAEGRKKAQAREAKVKAAATRRAGGYKPPGRKKKPKPGQVGLSAE